MMWIHITDSLMFMLGFTTADVWGLAHFKILYILLLLSCNWTSENTGFFNAVLYAGFAIRIWMHDGTKHILL